MSQLLPEPLLKQADAAVVLTGAVLNYFKTPGALAGPTQVKSAHEESRSFAAAVKAEQGPRREDWLAVSRGLAELSDNAAYAVDEAQRFQVSGDAALVAMAASLVEAATELKAALMKLERDKECAQHLQRAKGRALEVERAYRQGRAVLLEGIETVKQLKNGEVLKRLSLAAEASQQAAERIGELLTTK